MDCLVNIGIATLNGVTRIDPLLASLVKHTSKSIDHKILAIDDGSTERNLRQLRDLCAARGVELREHRRNQGIPATWNHLTERYESKYVVLLNDDVVVAPGWLDALVFFMEENPMIGTAGLHPIRDGKIVVCGGGELDLDHPDAQVPHRVIAANGYCFIFRKDLWDKVGRFDEEYLSFYEEVDFGVRCWQAGYQSYNIPWPPVDHEWSSTFQQNDDLLLPTIRMNNSKARFISKWGADLDETVRRLKEGFLAPKLLRWLTADGEKNGGRILEVQR